MAKITQTITPNNTAFKKILFKQRSDLSHWVGDGFPVRTVFSYNDIAAKVSPFLLMDYAGPTEFSPSSGGSSHRRGVGTHPHRGFETVTIVYSGQVEHRDSAGGGGVIEADEVQWMTAGSGLVHDEKHGKDFAKTGGRFEMVQLWVNLPRKDKMTKPRYQAIAKDKIPVVNLPNGAGLARVIAGQLEDVTGPAKTFSPIDLWDLRLKAGADLVFEWTEGHTAQVFLLSGQVSIGESESLQSLSEAEMAVLEPHKTSMRLKVEQDSKVLFMGGKPLNEPIVGYGPFVMNEQKDIFQAMKDFESGKMGTIRATDH